MTQPARSSFWRIRGSSSLLLLGLLGLYVSGGIIAQPGLMSFVWDILLYGVCFAGLRTVTRRKKVYLAAAFLMVPAIALASLATITGNRSLLAVSMVVNGLFLLAVIVWLLRYVLGPGEVTADRIAGAVCGYFLLGLLWALVFAVSEALVPGSLLYGGEQISYTRGGSAGSLIVYYSFTTLTTLGYGDIVPATAFTRSIAVLEAFFGQLYLAILVARLVGIHTADMLSRRDGAAPQRPAADTRPESGRS